jgi:hypothetical protein
MAIGLSKVRRNGKTVPAHRGGWALPPGPAHGNAAEPVTWMDAARPPGPDASRPAYGRAALMAKDSEALAYQAAALRETARGVYLRRADFFDRL